MNLKNYLLYIFLFSTGFIYLAPLLLMLLYSLMPLTQIGRFPPDFIPDKFMWINYTSALEFWNFFPFEITVFIRHLTASISKLYSISVTLSMSPVNTGSSHFTCNAPSGSTGGSSAPAAASADQGGGSEKKIKQAVYDIRYRARREDVELDKAFSQYMSNTNMSAMEKKAVRGKLFGESKIYNDI